MQERRMPRVSMMIFLAVVISGCESADPHVQLFREQQAAQKEVLEILRTVKDQETMKTARAELEKRFTRYEETKKKIALMLPPNRETVERLQKEIPHMTKNIEDLEQERRRLEALPGGKEFVLSLKNVGKAP
jgi:septal ring factor EnvC (AmiA/AmiB activator)